jgi:hypothetical protein
MNDQILLDDDGPTRKTFKTSIRTFNLVLASVIGIVLINLYRASQYLSSEGGIPSINLEIEQNLIFKLAELAMILTIIGFRISVYKALELPRLRIIGICLFVLTIIQTILNYASGIGFLELIYVNMIGWIGSLAALALIIELILIMLVPRSTVSVQFRFLRYFSGVQIATYVVNLFIYFSLYLSDFNLFAGNSTSYVTAITVILFTIPNVFMISAAQPTESIKEEPTS